MSMDEFVNVVGPSNVLDPGQLMNPMKENQGPKSPRIPSNTLLNINFDVDNEIIMRLIQISGSSAERECL